MPRKTPLLYEHVLRYLQVLVSQSQDRSVRLPTEAKLCRKFQVSRITVRRAYAELERKHLIHRMPRRGTFSRPQALQRSELPKGDNMVIGLVESSQWDMASQLVGQCVRHATQRAEQLGYSLAIIQLDTADLRRCRDGLIRHLHILSPAGLLLDARLPPMLAARLQKERIPCVAMYEDPELPSGIPAIFCPTEAILHLLVRHLKAHRHQCIGYLAGYSVAWAASVTIANAPRVWREEGLTLPRTHLLSGPYGADSGRRLGHRILNRKPRPTALICGDDMMALGAWQATEELGLCVPQDVAIAGIGNFLDPVLPLTTVDNGFTEISARAVDLLHQLIQGVRPQARTLVAPRLVPRASCGERLHPPAPK